VVVLKSRREIEVMRKANLIVHEVLERLEAMIQPGVTTGDLDRVADELTRKRGGVPAFKGYQGFPANLCASVNEEVVHGIPSRKRVLREGDIVGLDFGVIYEGYVGDAARTVAVGAVSDEARRLMSVTEEALWVAINTCWPGKRVCDLGQAVQEYVEARGYSVVRDFVGHGIGRKMHEEPQVPNYFNPANSTRLKPGMVLAIEPMINAGGHEVEILADGWTVVTKDRSLSAHYEHSVAVTETGPYILSQP
jgi:methionyl aminopeptidase